MASFRIILNGSIDETPSGLRLLKDKMKTFLGSNDETLQELFSSLPATLEEGLDLKTATALQETFKNLGAEIVLEDEANTKTRNELVFELENQINPVIEAREVSTKPKTEMDENVDLSDLSFDLEASTLTNETTPQKSATTPNLDFKLDDNSDKLEEPRHPSDEISKSETGTSLQIETDVESIPGFIPAETKSLKTEPVIKKTPAFAKTDQTSLPSEPEIQEIPQQLIIEHKKLLPKLSPKAIAAGAGSLAVILTAILFFSNNAPDKTSNIQISDPKILLNLLDQQKLIVENQRKEQGSASSNTGSIAIVPDSIWQTSVAANGINAEIELLSGQNQIIELNFKTQLPAKKKLTPEEIVAGLDAAPWIEKFSINNPRLTETAYKGTRIDSFNITLPGRAYIKDGLNAARVSAMITISGKLDTDNKTISGTWTFKTSDQSENEANTASGISKLENNLYRINYSGTLSLSKQPLPNIAN